MKRAILERVLAARTSGRTVAVVTDLATGTQALVDDGAVEGELPLSPDLIETARQAIRGDRSGAVEHEGARLFIHVHAPPARLIVVGAVHIGKPLVAMAAMAGYQVVLVDPRQTFAAQAGFEAATVIAAWPDEALAGLALDARTAVVTLTHDPKLDDAALQAALRSPAFYIGALGSRKTQAARLNRLAAAGFGEAERGRIHGPVGLAIGAATPAEIAIAILAEITQVRRQGEGCRAPDVVAASTARGATGNAG
jgi:Xanthine and CO dehydrogenases maturation factor, XdhC/CoxF family